MFCSLNSYAFLFFIVFVIHTSRVKSQPALCPPPLDNEGQAFLYLHNYASSNVRPTAANMNLYSWDPVLNLLATNLVNYCANGEVSTNPYGNLFGVNIAYEQKPIVSQNNGPQFAFNQWANEQGNYNFRDNTCDPGERCDQYKQIIWAETKYLGCAVGSRPCRNGKFIAVCVYSPKGNVEGQLPYIKGPACSQCEPGRQNCVEKLCAP